ncbi:MAG: hypothetical protein EOP06_06350 [Proteobacteria bacterium]|nr:MAG: hypothetical protein EOP06_06350 [Pseudomonadota bacterium]
MKIAGMGMITMFVAIASHAQGAVTYDQVLAVKSYVFQDRTIVSGDDLDGPPIEYWLEASIEEGFGVKFFCGQDDLICGKVRFELEDTLKQHSNRLSVRTTEEFLIPANHPTADRSCSYHYQHRTTLSSGREINLIERSPNYKCAAPSENLPCHSARHTLVQHPSGWKYCVWVGVR